MHCGWVGSGPEVGDGDDADGVESVENQVCRICRSFDEEGELPAVRKETAWSLAFLLSQPPDLVWRCRRLRYRFLSEEELSADGLASVPRMLSSIWALAVEEDVLLSENLAELVAAKQEARKVVNHPAQAEAFNFASPELAQVLEQPRNLQVTTNSKTPRCIEIGESVFMF